MSIAVAYQHTVATGCASSSGARRACAPVLQEQPDFDALSVLSLPSTPTPELSPTDVVQALCSGLKHCNTPHPGDGLRRLYHFTTYECRAALTSRKGYKSGPERFVQFAELHTLPGCRSFEIVGEPTLIPATMTRGAIASLAVDVVEVLLFRHKSGFERIVATDDGDGQSSDERLQDGVRTRTERYLFQLQQERRPPLAGCWMVTSVLPAREHMLFNGDSGAVQG